MWIADMDFAAPECVREALREYVDFGVFGYYLTPCEYTEEYLEWQERHSWQLRKRLEGIR